VDYSENHNSDHRNHLFIPRVRFSPAVRRRRMPPQAPSHTSITPPDGQKPQAIFLGHSIREQYGIHPAAYTTRSIARSIVVNSFPFLQELPGQNYWHNIPMYGTYVRPRKDQQCATAILHQSAPVRNPERGSNPRPSVGLTQESWGGNCQERLTTSCQPSRWLKSPRKMYAE
jgi:hypothetical protein